MKFFIKELYFFTFKQVKSTIFAGSFLILLFISNKINLHILYRYDFLFIGSVLIQFILIKYKLETKDEAKNIILFHLIGLILEIYKTSSFVGSWSYPEPGYLKVLNVPLYSGFMYSAVGSYIASSWKNFKLTLVNNPKYEYALILGFIIYLNFFTNHFIYDIRYIIILPLILIIYYKTKVKFTPNKKEYKMSLILSFLLIGFFVWVAENIATFYGAWKYPYQIHNWGIVSFHKISSWFLMVIISFIVVSYLKHYKNKKLENNKLI